MSPEGLKCNICPKKPTFSDVSHLLTHVSSKGHLSHYFKLQVRSHQEHEAGDLLADYDQWYNDNNLADLLSERMNAKEARRTKGEGDSRGGKNVNYTAPSRGPRHRRDTVSSAADNSLTTYTILKGEDRVPPPFLDPRMYQSYPAPPRNGQRQYELASSQSFGRIPGTMHHNSFNRVPAWNLPQGSSESTSLSSVSNDFRRELSSDAEEEIVSPLARRNRGLFQTTNRQLTASSRRRPRPTTPDPFIDDASFDCEEDDEIKVKVNEMTKLKGVLWPGMDIFDAATEQMRRKRNQKKDASILKQMEKTSEVVEPTEFVFSPGGTLRKQRLIYATAEDSSPLKGETPIPKKRIPKQRRPLPSGNANRNLKTFGKQQAGAGNRRNQPSQLEQLSRQTLPLLENPIDLQGPYKVGNYMCPDDMDFKLAFSTASQKSGHEFPVFNDEKKQFALSRGPAALADVTNIPYDQRTYDGSFMDMDSLSQHYDCKPMANQRSKYNSRAAELGKGKENIDPLLSQIGSQESTTWANQPFSNSGSRFATQNPYGAGFPGPYNTFTDNQAFGYTHNPLSFAFPPMRHTAAGPEFYPSGPQDLFVSPDRKQVKPERQVSPDGTVSDLDRDDFGQMYFDSIAK